MGFFTDIANKKLIRELERELNTDVVLFGADGFSYFGSLQDIDDCRVATLTPAQKAGTDFVEIQAPNEVLIKEKFARVDLFIIVAKATSITSDPFDDPPALAPTTPTRESENEPIERQESHNLIHFLKASVNDFVSITTLGGFAFTGILTGVNDELAILSADDIYVPGVSTSLTDVNAVIVNLEAITSVSSGNS